MAKVIEYGVRYLDGREDWNVRDWFGYINQPEHRKVFLEQYKLTTGNPDASVEFLERTVTYATPKVITDPTPEENNA